MASKSRADRVLPEDWDDLDVDAPEHLPDRITPRDLQEAVEKHDTLLEVTNALRSSRENVGMALGRLGLRDELESVKPSDLVPDGGSTDVRAVESWTLKPHPHELQRAITGDHVVVFGDEEVQFEVSGETDADDLNIDWSTIELSEDDVEAIFAGDTYTEQCEDLAGRPYTLEVRGGDRDPKGLPIHTEADR